MTLGLDWRLLYPLVSCYDSEHFVLDLEISAIDRKELLALADKLGEHEHVVEMELVDKSELDDKPEQVAD